MDGGQNNASNELRYVPKNAPIVGLMKPNQAFIDLHNQLHAAHHRSLEGVKQWRQQTTRNGDDESFCRKGGQERPQLPGGGRSSPASPLPTTFTSATLEDDERWAQKQQKLM
jgi:hypothetical protein